MVAHPRAQAARDRVTATMAEKIERKNRVVVFVAGAGHSGSTLLGLALGAHPEIFYAGEANKSQLLSDANAPLRKDPSRRERRPRRCDEQRQQRRAAK